jgi:hypothetical protein
MPVITDRVAKFFYVEGDSYCNVYLRNKTYLNTTKPEQIAIGRSVLLKGIESINTINTTLGATLLC